MRTQRSMLRFLRLSFPVSRFAFTHTAPPSPIIASRPRGRIDPTESVLMLSRLLHPLFAVLLLCCAGIALDASAATKHSRHHKSSHKKPSGPALVVRGDLATSRSLVNEIAEAYEDAG